MNKKLKLYANNPIQIFEGGRVKSFYKYCNGCSRAIDIEEYNRYSGYCSTCYYSKPW